MGNCLVLENKVIKVMKTDGKIIEYKAPMKVQQLLSEHANSAVSESLPVLQHLRPTAELLGGHLYYLLPLPPVVPPPEFNKKKKKVSFSETDSKTGRETRVVRIKVVISRQELEQILRKGGVSVSDQLQKERSPNGVDLLDSEGNENCRGWKPALESIAEVN